MIPVLYADEAMLVVVKPHQLLSVPGLGQEKQDCLWRRVQQQYPTARIVHRLDYATSGLMVMALTAVTHRHLSMQFQNRITKKRYQAIVSGQVRGDEGSIELPLRCDWERRPLQIVDHEQGKSALTHWQCLERNDQGSRLLLHPITGRSHQLRVHLQAIGHPILGDEFYAEGDAREASPRLLLHAEQLALQHPLSEEWLAFESACPF